MKSFAPFLILFGILSYFIPNGRIDSELQSYYDSYMAIVEKHCEHKQLNLPILTEISFVNGFLKKGVVAVCMRSNFGWKIEVKRSFWDAAKLNLRAETIYHELSHCILWAEHSNNPKNYMYFESTYIDIKDTNDQVLEDAWNYCGNK